MENCALILIDIQNFYFKEGQSRLSDPEKAADNAKKILDYFRENNKPVFFIKHCTGIDFDENIYEEVKPLDNEKVIEKHYPNSFLKTSLKEELDKNNVKEVCIVGMMSHMCVDTTARACQDYGYKVTVIDDACNTKDLVYNNEVIKAEIVHKVFMASLSGMFADIKMTEEFLKENK